MGRQVIAEIKNSQGVATGRVETTGENGLKIVSLKQDPSEIRGTVKRGQVESNMFKITIGLERDEIRFLVVTHPTRVTPLAVS